VRQHPYPPLPALSFGRTRGDVSRLYLQEATLLPQFARALGGERSECAGGVCFGAGSEADVRVFKDLELDLPEGSSIYADKGYTDDGY
jgi:hypothetical protein